MTFFLLAAAGSLATTYKIGDATAFMALPFALLAVNLCAALFAHPRFRADLPLLLFHLALLALILLFALGRLSYVDGKAVVTRGTAFAGQFEQLLHGPLHGAAPRVPSFINDGFVEGEPRSDYPATRNRVRWEDDASGRELSAEIGSDRPLVLGGYRIYPMRYRGFSPRMAWQPATGPVEYGMVPLPPLTAGQDEFPRGAGWSLSDGTELWAQLRTGVSADELNRRPNLGAADLDHVLVIRRNDARYELRPGQSLDLGHGRLSYLSLDSWIAYRIVRDPTEPWVAAAILLAVGSLAWFYARRAGGSATDGNANASGTAT